MRSTAEVRGAGGVAPSKGGTAAATAASAASATAADERGGLPDVGKVGVEECSEPPSRGTPAPGEVLGRPLLRASPYMTCRQPGGEGAGSGQAVGRQGVSPYMACRQLGGEGAGRGQAGGITVHGS